MRTRIIGVGAAGNKAAISATINGVESIDNVLLVNSTMKDIPEDYKGKKFKFTDSYGGCGKERKLARELAYNSISSGDMQLNEFLGIDTEKEAELVVVVSSTEGGTGSGASPIIAEYIADYLKIPVHCFAFTGFEEDGRGLMNTVQYFQEMHDTFTVECIQNSKFMDEYNNNKIKAEKAANDEFCKKISILFGNPLRDSAHNIDPTDLFKIAKEPGYTVIETRPFSKIKNREQFRELVTSMIDESKALDINEPSQKKMAVIININENSTDIIDYQDILVERFGKCFEKFEHIQHEDEEMPEFFAFISAGSKIPSKEIEAIYERYKESTAKVDKTTDGFFGKKFNFEDQDEMFDVGSPDKKKDRNVAGFFNKYKNVESKDSRNRNLKTATITEEDVDDVY